MSTHGIVGIKTATGFVGRYVHFDGYPRNMMRELEMILNKHGFEHAADVLTGTSWQFLDTRPREGRNGDVKVPGFGVADDPQFTDEQLYTEKDGNAAAEWAYALHAGGVQVWRHDWANSHWDRAPEHDFNV